MAKKKNPVKSLYEIKSNGSKGKLLRKLELGNPVTVLANELMALLNKLDGVITAFDYNTATLGVFVSKRESSDALRYFLVREHKLGNLTLKVRIWDATIPDTPEEMGPQTWTVTDEAELRHVEHIFKGSDLEPKITVLVDQYKTRWEFLEFPPVTIQFQADTLLNPTGFDTVLLADTVRKAFKFDKYKISTMNTNK
jgi:hypothetical protein